MNALLNAAINVLEKVDTATISALERNLLGMLIVPGTVTKFDAEEIKVSKRVTKPRGRHPAHLVGWHEKRKAVRKDNGWFKWNARYRECPIELRKVVYRKPSVNDLFEEILEEPDVLESPYPDPDDDWVPEPVNLDWEMGEQREMALEYAYPYMADKFIGHVYYPDELEAFPPEIRSEIRLIIVPWISECNKARDYAREFFNTRCIPVGIQSF